MIKGKPLTLDVAVVGGGPAGISSCVELSKSSKLKIALFESEKGLGGIPRSCHNFFGLRDLKRIYSGPAYARKLSSLAQKIPVEIHTQATVLNIIPGGAGEVHRINVVSPEGSKTYESRFVILATGCCERPLADRIIPSARPAGIFTTWQLQQMVNIHHLKPGKQALIIGSEHVALSTVMTLKRAGVSIAGIVEEDAELQTYSFLAKAMSSFYGFSIYKDTLVKAISGTRRVEGVELVTQGKQAIFRINCDTVIITGKFRPISALIDNTPIVRDPATYGPVVDMNLMTSGPNIFAAGNILRGGDMHDLCAIEGKLAARNLLKKMKSTESEKDEWISIRAEPPIRYVVPQIIAPSNIGTHLFSRLFPGFAIQIEHTLKNPVLEAWSGDKKIWNRSYSKLIANHRISIPVEKFNWNRVDSDKGIKLKFRA